MGKHNSLNRNKFSMLSSNLFPNNYHKALTKQNCPSYLPKPHTHENHVRKKSTQTWNFEVPHVKMLHDSENAFLSRYGAEMVTKGWSFVGQQWWMREKKKKAA